MAISSNPYSPNHALASIDHSDQSPGKSDRPNPQADFELPEELQVLKDELNTGVNMIEPYF